MNGNFPANCLTTGQKSRRTLRSCSWKAKAGARFHAAITSTSGDKKKRRGHKTPAHSLQAVFVLSTRSCPACVSLAPPFLMPQLISSSLPSRHEIIAFVRRIRVLHSPTIEGDKSADSSPVVLAWVYRHQWNAAS